MYPQNSFTILNRTFNKRKFAFFVVTFVVIVVGLILFFTRPGKLVIETEEGGTIYVATERGGELKKIGETKATFSSRKIPQEVFVMVTSGEKKTMVHTELTERKSTKRQVELKQPLEAQKVVDGSISNISIRGKKVQGVMPGEFRLINFNLETFEPIRSVFTASPQVSNVIWYNHDNFVYKAFDGRIGRFVNGKDVSSLNLGRAITGPGNQKSSVYGEKGIAGRYFLDIAKTNNRPLILLSREALFSSDDMGETMKKLVTFDRPGENYRVYADDDYIYHLVGGETADYATETEDATTEESVGSAKIYKHNYSGELIETIEINGDNALSIITTKGTTHVLTKDFIATNKVQTPEATQYFTFLRDVVEYEDRAFLLADNGVWEVGDNGSTSYLVATLPENNVGIFDSLMVEDGKILFSTGQKPEGPAVQGSIYSINLK